MLKTENMSFAPSFIFEAKSKYDLVSLSIIRKSFTKKTKVYFNCPSSYQV